MVHLAWILPARFQICTKRSCTMEVDFGFQPPSGVVMSRPGLARSQRGGSVMLCHHWMNATTIREPEVRNQSEPATTLLSTARVKLL